MKKDIWAFLYGFLMMLLILLVSILLSNALKVDINTLLLCQAITVLLMIWYTISIKSEK